jgi:uncharacterized protein HemX
MFSHFSGGVEELLAGNGEFHKHVQTKSKIFKSLHQAIRTQRKDWQLAVAEASLNVFRLAAQQRIISFRSS